MFAEHQRIGVETFEIGAEHIEKLLGRRVAAFLLAFENHNLSGAHRVSDLLAERRVEVRPDQHHHVETAWQQRNSITVVIKAKHGSHGITALLVARLLIGKQWIGQRCEVHHSRSRYPKSAIPDNSYYQEWHFSRPSRQRAFTLATKPYKNTQKHVVSQLDIAIAWRINQEEKNMDKLLEGLERPERMANIIAQQPKYIRDDIASLVEDEQKLGSFGDLIKRSVELAGAHNEFQGSNVVSMIGRCSRNNDGRGHATCPSN